MSDLQKASQKAQEFRRREEEILQKITQVPTYLTHHQEKYWVLGFGNILHSKKQTMQD